MADSDSTTKICDTCNIEKPIDLFRSRRNSCRECERNKLMEYYWRNVDSSRAAMREYHHKNKERKSNNLRRWRVENKEHVLEYGKQRFANTTVEEKKAIQKRWHLSRAGKAKQYRERNKEHFAELIKKWRASPKGKAQHASTEM